MKIKPGDGRVSIGQGDEAEGGSDRDAYLLNHFPSHLPVKKRKIPEALPMPPLSTSGMKSLPKVSWGGEGEARRGSLDPPVLGLHGDSSQLALLSIGRGCTVCLLYRAEGKPAV